MICAFCGQSFLEAAARQACHGCLVAGCRSRRCPHCGYEMPERSRVLDRILGWWRQAAGARQQPVLQPGEATPLGIYRDGDLPLTELAAGRSALVTGLRPQPPERLRKLLALGLLPGCQVKLRRHSPLPLLQVGHGQLALDRTLAAAVLVRPEADLR